MELQHVTPLHFVVGLGWRHERLCQRGIALVETQRLTPSGGHSEQGIGSYSENSFSASTRRMTL